MKWSKRTAQVFRPGNRFYTSPPCKGDRTGVCGGCNPGLKTWAILLDHYVVNKHLRTRTKPGGNHHRDESNGYKDEPTCVRGARHAEACALGLPSGDCPSIQEMGQRDIRPDQKY